VFPIAPITGFTFGPGRAEFIQAQVAIAVHIKLGQGGDRIGDLHRVDDTVPIGVEGGDQRGNRAAASFGPGGRNGGVVGGGEAQCRAGGQGEEEGFVDEVHDGCRCVVVVFRAAGPPLFRPQETPVPLRLDGENRENC
jgi:hypothetical protein